MSGQILSAAISLGLGFAFAESWEEVAGLFGAFSSLVLVGIIGIFLIVVLIRRVRRRRRASEQDVAEPEIHELLQTQEEFKKTEEIN